MQYAGGFVMLTITLWIPVSLRAQEIDVAPVYDGEPVTLEWVLEQLPQRHETWEITEMQIRQSETGRRQALAGLLPSLNLSAQFTRQSGDEVEVQGEVFRSNTDWGMTTRLGVRLFDAPAYLAYQQSGKLLEVTEAGVRWRRHLMLREGELAFFRLVAAQREVEIAESARELRQAYLEQAEALMGAGMAISVDVSRARAQVLEAEQRLLDAELARGDAADELAMLLGYRPDGALRAAFEGMEEMLSIDEGRGLADEARPDFQSSLLGIEASGIGRRSTWASVLPTLELGATSQLGRPIGFNPEVHVWSVGLSLNWLLYDGGARYARIDQQEAQIREQELMLQQELRQASVEISRARRQFRRAMSAVDVAEEQVKVARETYEIVSARFDAGLATSLEVSDASQALFQAEVALNQLRLQTRQAEIQVRYLEDLPE